MLPQPHIWCEDRQGSQGSFGSMPELPWRSRHFFSSIWISVYVNFYISVHQYIICVCECEYVCILIRLYMCACEYKYICVYVKTCAFFVCEYLLISVYVNIFVHLYMWIIVYMCVYVNNSSVYVCRWILVYMWVCFVCVCVE